MNETGAIGGRSHVGLDGVGLTAGVDDSIYCRFGAVEEIVDDTNLGAFAGE